MLTESTPLIVQDSDDHLDEDGPNVNNKSNENVENEGTTNLATMIHLLKANIGSGILGLPFAMKHGGIIAGPLFLLLVALMTVHCMQLLVRCAHFFCQKEKIKALSYGELASHCSKDLLKDKSRHAKLLVNIFVIITQLGFCTAFLVLVSSTIVQIAGWNVEYRRLVTLLLAVPCVLLSFIRSLEKLAYVSMLANLLAIFGLISIFQYCARELKDPKSYPGFSGWKELPTFLSMTIFSFEAISVILPLENKTKNREDFTWIVNVAMGIITCLFLLMGLLGYIAFGDTIKGSITLSLPATYFYDSVKASYAVAMFLTYFIQFYVPVETLLPPFLEKLDKDGGSWWEYFLRTFLVFLTITAATTIPQVENVTSLIGAICGSALALIFPPLIHMLTFQGNGLTMVEVVKDVFIIMMGFVGFLLGGYTSVLNVTKGFSAVHTRIHNSTTLVGQ